MKIQMRKSPISYKTDQDTDQDTFISNLKNYNNTAIINIKRFYPCILLKHVKGFRT